MQYSGLIGLSKIFLVLLPPNAHSTDSSLDHSTPHCHFFNTRFALFGSAVTPYTAPSVVAARCTQRTTIARQLATDTTLPATRLSHSFCPLAVYATYALFEYPTLFQSVVPEATSSLILFREGAGIMASLVVWRQRLRRSPRY